MTNDEYIKYLAKLKAEALKRVPENYKSAKQNLYDFIKFTKADFVEANHIKIICNYIMELLGNHFNILLISMPPQHGKTEVAVRRLIPFLLGVNPNEKIIFLTHSLKKAYKESREIQRILNSKEYKLLFPDVKILPANSSRDEGGYMTVERFKILNAKGQFIAGSMKSGTAGESATTIVIDDPFKNRQEGTSIEMLEKIWNVFLSDVKTRHAVAETKNLKLIVIQTRWHKDDLIGKILENEDDYYYLRLPAIADEYGLDPLDFREFGEPIWNEKFDLKKLQQIKEIAGSSIWLSLYQQTPPENIAEYYDEKYFKLYKESERTFEFEQVFFTIDLAISQKETADYTVILVAGIYENKLYIIDYYRGRVKGNEIINLIRNYYEHYEPEIIGVEAVQYQLSIIHQLQSFGIPTIKLIPKGDKIQRAMPVVALIEAGSILFNSEMKNYKSFVSELVQFPYGKHDDIVDALNYAGEYFIKYNQKKKKFEFRTLN